MNVNEKISLLLRHADRDDIPQGSFGNEILLNEKGKQNAQIFGEKFAQRKINRIFTSPVGRCIQTAEYMTKGYGRSIEIIETTALGAPGLHIKDEKIAGDFFLQHGFDEMYNRFMQGKEIPGVCSIEEMKSSMTKFITDNTENKGITLFISHDMIIAMYHYCLNKTVYTKENWINFLTGITFKNGIYER